MVGKKGWRIFGKRSAKNEMSEVDYFAEMVLEEISPRMANRIVGRSLLNLELPDFFALTTSLTTANQLKPTREVESQTASGE